MKLLSQIKQDLEFNRNLHNLIEILKQIALAQYHDLEKKIRSYGNFFALLESVFTMIEINSDKSGHPLINISGRPPGVIAITSDSGLLGGLNLQVMNLAITDVVENHGRLIVVGEKGKNFAIERNISYIFLEGIKDEARFLQAAALRDYVFNEELKRSIGSLKIIYPHPISVVLQKIRVLQLLPFTKEALGTALASGQAPAGLILESSAADIVEYIIFLFLGHKFNEIFELSRLAELSARFVHLEESKTKIEELNRQLRMQYFRQRHELIDRSMRELFAARLAFR